MILLCGVAQARKPSLVKIRIDSTPPGANVYLDGKEGGIVGQTGGGDPLKLPKGAHRLFLELEGYKTFEQTVNLASGQRFAFKLQPEAAHLDIKPPGTNQTSLGGDVFVDGTQVGTVPAKLDVSVGRHTVEVRRPGYLVYTEQIELKIGETRQLLVTLYMEPKEKVVVVGATTGALMINATIPADTPGATVEVLVDNQPRGQAPVLVDNLAPGDHWVELQLGDKKYPPWRRTVKVAVGQQGTVVGKFEADPTVQVSVVPRNTHDNYVVTLGQAQACQTPCMLRALPGRQVISVAGPGSRQFRSEITLPNSPAQITVQHFTLGKSVGGAIALAYGLPSLIAASIAADNANKASGAAMDDNTKTAKGLEAFAYGTLAFTGATSALSAIITLATIKLNRASVDRMGQLSALPRPKVRFLLAGVAPTTDRSGAISSLHFAF